MSGPLSNPYMFKSAAGGADFYTHQISNSCRFDGAGKFLITNGSAPTNAKKYTFSTWVKRSELGNKGELIAAETNNVNYDDFNFNSSDELEQVSQRTSSYKTSDVRLFRDPSAFYHVVAQWDTSLASATDRLKVYINGVRLTWDQTAYDGALPQDTALKFNENGASLSIGYSVSNSGIFEGYMAQTAGIDGSIVAIGDLGETKNGVWIAKDLSGLTFGNNGFLLDYASSSDMGNDVSGNNNDFTPTSISAHDQMLDSPTFNSNSNGGNFPTYNPLLKAPTGLALSEGNLKATLTVDDNGIMTNWQVPVTGKWYWEIDVDSIAGSHGVYIGVMPANTDLTINQESNNLGLVYYSINGNSILKGTRSSYGATYTTGDIISIAVDRDADTIQFYKNGSGQGTIDISSLDEEFFCYMGYTGGSGPCSTILNFGQDGTFAGNVTAGGNSDGTGYGNFKYSVPSGFLALCSGNQPIADAINPAETDTGYPQKQFNALLYTGDGGSSRAITGLGFQPDWIWIKRRNAAENHNMYDAVRGANKRIQPNRSVVESTEGLPAIGSDGFTVDASGGICNVSSQTYVAWNAKANGGGSSNSDGGTTSTVSANTDIGFSIVQYAGAGGTQTIGHGLDKAPEFMSCKPTAGYAYQWVAYHKNGNDGATGQNGYLAWETTGGFSSLSTIWNNTAPTSTVFTTGGSQNTGASGGTYINYCWHSVEGVTDVGMYIGNGSTDGAFVYTGFKPAFIIIKGLASGAGWNLHDNKTSPFNVASTALQSNTSSAELSNYNIDMVSNGFKIRDSDGDLGTDGNKYIYVAMAENPFKYATAR